MKFITVKEAAQKWQLTQRSVQLYCKNNKIPGAKLIGKQWLVPDEVEKPADCRTKVMKTTHDYSTYHFPIFVYSQFFADRSGLSPDEITLLDAQINTVRGEHIQSLEICKKLIETTVSSSVRFGAYATNAQNYILLGLFTEVSLCLSAMESIRNGNPDHGADYDLVLNYFRFLCAFNTKYFQSDVDLRLLSPSALDVFELSSLNTALYEKAAISPEIMRYIEIFCTRTENAGIAPTALITHGQLALYYSQLGDNSNKQFHMEQVARIGFEHKLYTSLSRVSVLNHKEYMPIFKTYGKDFAEKAHKVHLSNRKNLAANLTFHSPLAPAGKLALLDASKWEFLILLSNGFSNKLIAEVKGITPKQVSAVIGELCEVLGYQTKAELVKYANTCFMPRESNMELLQK